MNPSFAAVAPTSPEPERQVAEQRVRPGVQLWGGGHRQEGPPGGFGQF